LIRAASGSMALSKASGPSMSPPVICPRSAILHSAAASMVEGILVVTVSTADRIATRGSPRPMPRQRSMAFWTMSRLVSRSGKMLIAASVMKSVSAWPGTSMTKTWLMRRSVRRPVAAAVTACISSSVCRLPFISMSPLPLADQRHGPLRRGVAVGGVDDLDPAEVEPVVAATRADLRSGPTRIGTMSPRPAASTAPRSEPSSQGWADDGARDPPRVDAREARRLLVLADGEEVAAEDRAVQHEPGDDRDQSEGDDGVRHPAAPPRDQPFERRERVPEGKSRRPVGGVEPRDAPVDQEPAERHDKGL
jgi:hypothetical protein